MDTNNGSRRNHRGGPNRGSFFFFFFFLAANRPLYLWLLGSFFHEDTLTQNVFVRSNDLYVFSFVHSFRPVVPFVSRACRHVCRPKHLMDDRSVRDHYYDSGSLCLPWRLPYYHHFYYCHYKQTNLPSIGPLQDIRREENCHHQ